jgi:hypothetical protein
VTFRPRARSTTRAGAAPSGTVTMSSASTACATPSRPAPTVQAMAP